MMEQGWDSMIKSTIDASETYKKWRLTIAIEADSRRPLKCTYCRRSYKYKLSLKMHIKEAHMKTATIEPNERYNRSNNKENQPEPQRLQFSMVQTTETLKHNPTRRKSVIIQNPNIY